MTYQQVIYQRAVLIRKTLRKWGFKDDITKMIVHTGQQMESYRLAHNMPIETTESEVESLVKEYLANKFTEFRETH